MARILRIILFTVGLLAGIMASFMFYSGQLVQGFAFLSMSAIFLLMALLAWLRAETSSPQQTENEHTNLLETNKAQQELAFFVANLAVQHLRDVGRTIPPSTKEIDVLEEQIVDLFNIVDVPKANREEIQEDLDRIRGRIRRSEGGRALIRSVRL